MKKDYSLDDISLNKYKLELISDIKRIEKICQKNIDDEKKIRLKINILKQIQDSNLSDRTLDEYILNQTNELETIEKYKNNIKEMKEIQQINEKIDMLMQMPKDVAAVNIILNILIENTSEHTENDDFVDLLKTCRTNLRS